MTPGRRANRNRVQAGGPGITSATITAPPGARQGPGAHRRADLAAEGTVGACLNAREPTGHTKGLGN